MLGLKVQKKGNFLQQQVTRRPEKGHAMTKYVSNGSPTSWNYYVTDHLGYYTGKHHLDDDLVFLWLLAGMPVLIVSVIWGINELMAWMNGK